MIDFAVRPSRRDDQILSAAASAMLPAYTEWCGGIPADEKDAARKSLMRAMRHDYDGYQIVKELEHYDCIWGDSELVEIMDRATHELWEAETAAVAIWVADHAFFPAFRVGDRVAHPWGEGIVDSIDAGSARYVVRGQKHAAGCGALVPYEDARLVAEAQP